MSKRPLFLDFRNVELPNIDLWAIVTLPIRLLGRVAIDSVPGAETRHPVASDVVGETKSNSRH